MKSFSATSFINWSGSRAIMSKYSRREIFVKNDVAKHAVACIWRIL